MLILALAGFLGIAAQTASHTSDARSSRTASARSLADSVKKDPETGLAIDPQLMLVKGQCTACHSSKLILQSRFSRDKWIERIRWMQRTQKLWDLGESEPIILDYLVKYYGPATGSFDGRREPLQSIKWYKLESSR